MTAPFFPANILIPKEGFEKWSVIACDQYTSDSKYWKDVENTVADAPSSLRITLPEIFLEDNDVSERVEKINETMKKYLSDGIFEELKNTFIYVERTLRSDTIRKGIIGVIDLEAYDFSTDSTALVRATERTVTERIPPRVKIRQNAPLELPHIMVLFDDPGDSIFSSLAKFKPTMKKVYDFKLMKNSGYISGWKADGAAAEDIKKGFDDLLKRSTDHASGKAPLLFAVGDGNHSLATAKTCWEAIKKDLTEEQRATHPARFALAEAVNIHDSSLDFEPIHRVLFNTNTEIFREELLNYFKGRINEDLCEVNDFNDFVTVSTDYEHVYELTEKKTNLTIGDVQEFLDYYIKEVDTGAKIDYIHGDGTAIELGRKENNVAILMPSISKSDLFDMVMLAGVLPRKTFSMGEADDKRFYLEAKQII
ncbi:MAG: DUF1015 domain-containing protein [Ruminococcaceae bacterium]|nr:DUF1015 domain-containing protein [Oscillospiraceae bacterium]